MLRDYDFFAAKVSGWEAQDRNLLLSKGTQAGTGGIRTGRIMDIFIFNFFIKKNK